MKLFPAEEYDTLLGGLRRLFPASPFGPDQLDRLRSSAPSLFHGGWSLIGTLVREDKWLGVMNKKVAPELPEEVKYVDIIVHKLLPSAVALSIDVALADSATSKLNELQNRMYLPVTTLSRFTPWKGYRTGMSHAPAEWSMEEKMLRWQRTLHADVWSCVRARLFGFFGDSATQDGSFPIIDCFAVVGVPDGDGEIHTRVGSLHKWLESTTVLPGPSGLDKYTRGELMFVREQLRDNRLSTSYRFVEFHTVQPEPDPTKQQGFAALRDELDAALPYICFIAALRQIAEQVETLRLRVYKRLSGARLFGRSFRFEMKLNDKVQREAMFVSRVSMELIDALPHLKRNSAVLRGLTEKLDRDHPERELLDDLDGTLSFRLRQVKRHLRLISKVFDAYISRRNVRLMYSLQRQVWVLTFIATLAAVASILTNWGQLRQIIAAVFRR